MTRALPETCLNCGKAISEEMDYCPNCGQKIRKAKLPLKTFISDFFEDYFTVDSSFFQSLKKLVFAPGALTREFNEGKRKKYIAPFRLYIFISFIFFFLLALNIKYTNDFQENSMIEFGDSEDEELSTNADTLKADEPIATVDTASVDNDGDMNLDVNFDEDPEASALEAFFEERARRAGENPELFMQSLFKASSITMFVMLPFFGLLLLLFHIKKHKYYVEHLVHSVHFHSFLFLIFLFALLANWIFDWNAFGLVYLVAFVYLILSLRASYGQSYLKSILKAFFLIPIYLMFIGISMVIVVFGAILLT